MVPKHTKAELAVLKRITPPAKPPAIIARVLKQVDAMLKRQQVLASVHLGGSMAKGTYLKGDHDVDVFIRFSPQYKDDEISDRLEAVLKRAFKGVARVHGSRDYFHIQQGSFTFEFIPVLHITSWQEAVNVTDMSPLHVAYVAGHIEERQYLAGEIRLTKQFCKAAKIYGAESYIGGFSGHVIDLLNIHYDGFHNLLAAAAKWPAKAILDPEHHHDNPLIALNDAKTYAPLVIVDPIQPDRNSAAALTADVFKSFKMRANEYLAASPQEQEEFFIVKPLDVRMFKAQHHAADICRINIVPLQGKKDVVGAKCLKVYEYLAKALLENHFSIIATAWEFTQKKAIVLFALPRTKLPHQEELAGPPINRTIDVERFKQMHKMIFTKEGRIFAVERRRYTQPVPLLAATLKNAYVKERVKSVKIWKL